MENYSYNIIVGLSGLGGFFVAVLVVKLMDLKRMLCKLAYFLETSFF